MGWDAYSSAPHSKSVRGGLKYKKHREAFNQAVYNVRKNAGSVDGMLQFGGLDCSLCREMMRKAAGLSKKELNWGLAWHHDGMKPEFVKVMHMFLNWNFKYKKEDAWAYWSAKEFVRVCADNGLSIKFTY